MMFVSKGNTPGQTLWSVASGRLVITRECAAAVEYINELEGFCGVHIDPASGNTLWFFDTLNNAKRGRNLMQAKGIQCGRNICKFKMGPDGVTVMEPNWNDGKTRSLRTIEDVRQ